MDFWYQSQKRKTFGHRIIIGGQKTYSNFKAKTLKAKILLGQERRKTCKRGNNQTDELEGNVACYLPFLTSLGLNKQSLWE